MTYAPIDGEMGDASASEVQRGIDINAHGNLDGDIDADVDAAALLDELARLPEGPDDDGDIVTSAFSRLGRRLVVLSDSELTTVARTLLRACSTGGAMASACLPEDAHAARQVLTALLVVARKDTAAPAPLATLMSQFLPRLREGATDDAARVLRRTAPSLPTSVRRLLDVLLDGATRAARSDDESPAVRARAAANRPRGGTGEYAVVSPAEQDAGPLVPVRLGLSLLAETAVSRARERSQVIEDRVLSPTDPERSGEGWGAARAAWRVEGTRSVPEPRPGAALPVILCVAGAVGSAMNGAAIIAGVLAVAALLLATRRAPNRND